MTASASSLIDPFARRINYVRLSVTDRCDFRCVYCMAEDMQFLPRSQILTLEEIARIGHILTGLGVRTLRLTGGEPLIRRDLPWLVAKLADLQQPVGGEVTMTTNGARLDKLARPLKAAGLGRINISLDTLDAAQFTELTRTGRLDQVLRGIEAAKHAGFAIRLNAVILKGRNDDQILPLVRFAVAHELDMSFIEEMPLGQITEHSRALSLMTSEQIRQEIARDYAMTPSGHQTAGPARYWQLQHTRTRVGLISPHSHNFCADCNRIRISAEGRLLLCLGHEQGMDLREPLRSGLSDEQIAGQISAALAIKPERHQFDLQAEEVGIVRFMNMTGG